MGTVQLNEIEMATLMILKALNDFKPYNLSNDNFDYKLKSFRFIEDDEGFTKEEFGASLMKLYEMGIFIVNCEEVAELTLKGKALMVALSAMKSLTDDVKNKIFNGTIKAVDFVKENKSEIIAIIIAIWQEFN